MKRVYAGLIAFALLTLAVGHARAQQPTTKPLADATKPAAASGAAPSEDVVSSFIRHYFGYNPSFTWKVDSIQPSEIPGMSEVLMTYTSGDQPQRMRFYVTADGKHAIFGDAVPFAADPFRADRELLERKANGVAEGAAGSAVQIVEFSDLQCPHCKVAYPTLQRLLSEEPDAKLVFQNFPLPMHDWAQKAAQYADCVGQKNTAAFWRFVSGVFDAQESITSSTADARLVDLANTAGVDGRTAAACAALPATAERVKRSFDLGRELNVSGTPTVFINGRRISSVNALPYEELKAIVDFEVQLAKTPTK